MLLLAHFLSLSLPRSLSVSHFWGLPFLFLISLCNLSTAFIFFMGSISGFFPALFCPRKIGSHTVTAKRGLGDPLAISLILFSQKPQFREGKGLPGSNLSLTFQISYHCLCEASPDTIEVLWHLIWKDICDIHHSVVGIHCVFSCKFRGDSLAFCPIPRVCYGRWLEVDSQYIGSEWIGQGHTTS